MVWAENKGRQNFIKGLNKEIADNEPGNGFPYAKPRGVSLPMLSQTRAMGLAGL